MFSARLFLPLAHSSSENVPHALEQRQKAIVNALEALEQRFHGLQNRLRKVAPAADVTNGKFKIDIEKDLLGKDTETQQRLRRLCEEKGLTRTKFKRTPMDYYDRPLEWRRDYLQAASTNQLCKTIFVENSRFVADTDLPDGVDPELNPSNARYYALIVQYESRGFNNESLCKFIREQRPKEKRLPRKNFNFRLCDRGEELTGYTNNGVTPLGMATPCPIIVSKHITREVEEKRWDIWLGGGEYDVKWRVNVDDFVQAMGALVGDIQ